MVLGGERRHGRGSILRTRLRTRRFSESATLAERRRDAVANSRRAIAANVVHEFNNMLSGIIGNVELARMSLSPTHPSRRALADVIELAMRGVALQRRILMVGNAVLRASTADDPHSLAVEIADGLRGIIPAPTTYSIEQFESEADSTRIDVHVCANAALSLKSGSARTAMPNGKVVIQVHSANVPSENSIVRIFSDDDGLAATTIATLLSSFGAVAVRNVERRRTASGTPSQPATTLVHSATTVATPALRPLHIAFVDDEEILVRLFSRSIAKLGHRVTGFTSGAAALTALDSAEQDFDVVLADYNMPGTSGLVIAARCKSRTPPLPVVITSGYVTLELEQRARALGVSSVVEKPDVKAMMAAVVAAAGR